MSASANRRELLLIHAGRPCPACRRTRRILEAAVTVADGQVTLRETSVDSAEARQLGATMTPMVLLDGRIVSAGMVPLASALRHLLDGGGEASG